MKKKIEIIKTDEANGLVKGATKVVDKFVAESLIKRKIAKTHKNKEK